MTTKSLITIRVMTKMIQTRSQAIPSLMMIKITTGKVAVRLKSQIILWMKGKVEMVKKQTHLLVM